MAPRHIKAMLIPVLGPIYEKLLIPLRPDRVWTSLRPEIARYVEDDPEHVAVLYNGQRRDMFVGETSAINSKHIRNIRATEIYRANALARDPTLDPESLPAICGPAVLFPDEIVWS